MDKKAGYLNVDVAPQVKPDLLIRNGDYSAIPRDYFEEVYARDVLEHIPRAESLATLLDWASWLKIGGKLEIQTSSILGVADRLRAAQSYAEHHSWTLCLFGNQAHASDFHHTAFTEITLRVHLCAAGFEVGAFELVDGWMLRTTARKRESWDACLPDMIDLPPAEFADAIYRAAFGRDAEDDGKRYVVGSLKARTATRAENLKRVFSSPERLYVTALRLGL